MTTSYELTGCPACRSNQFREVADRQQIKQELESLWQFHLRRLRAGAPIDQLFDRAIFSQQPPLHVVMCEVCGTVFRNPREREDELVETYAAETPSSEALDSLFAYQRAFYHPRVQKLTFTRGSAGSVLEVGSYIGAFLSAAKASGWRATGIDVNAHATAYARAQGCAAEEKSLGDFAPNEKFDAVVLWNCFDQLPDPHEALGKVDELLSPGGQLALRVPNGGFYARVRRWPAWLRRELLAWNNLASFPYRHGFTDRALKHMLDEHNYDLIDLHADVLVPLAGTWTRGWARWEERILKAGMKMLATPTFAPWLEVYARRRGH